MDEPEVEVDVLDVGDVVHGHEEDDNDDDEDQKDKLEGAHFVRVGDGRLSPTHRVGLTTKHLTTTKCGPYTTTIHQQKRVGLIQQQNIARQQRVCPYNNNNTSTNNIDRA